MTLQLALTLFTGLYKPSTVHHLLHHDNKIQKRSFVVLFFFQSNTALVDNWHSFTRLFIHEATQQRRDSQLEFAKPFRTQLFRNRTFLTSSGLTNGGVLLHWPEFVLTSAISKRQPSHRSRKHQELGHSQIPGTTPWEKRTEIGKGR